MLLEWRGQSERAVQVVVVASRVQAAVALVVAPQRLAENRLEGLLHIQAELDAGLRVQHVVALAPLARLFVTYLMKQVQK